MDFQLPECIPNQYFHLLVPDKLRNRNPLVSKDFGSILMALKRIGFEYCWKKRTRTLNSGFHHQLKVLWMTKMMVVIDPMRNRYGNDDLIDGSRVLHESLEMKTSYLVKSWIVELMKPNYNEQLSNLDVGIHFLEGKLGSIDRQFWLAGRKTCSAWLGIQVGDIRFYRNGNCSWRNPSVRKGPSLDASSFHAYDNVHQKCNLPSFYHRILPAVDW